MTLIKTPARSCHHVICRMFTCNTGGSLTSVLHLYHYRVRCLCGCGALLLVQKLAMPMLSLACLRGAWPNIAMHCRTFATGKRPVRRQRRMPSGRGT